MVLVISAMSALIGAAALAGWVRSYWIVDQTRVQGWKTDGDFARWWLKSDRGSIGVGYASFAKSFYLSPYSAVADYPNGFVWQTWKPQVGDDEGAAVYKRLGMDWNSDAMPGAYHTWTVQFPYWLIIVLASLLPAKWFVARRRDRRLVGFDLAPSPTSAASAANAAPPA